MCVPAKASVILLLSFLNPKTEEMLLLSSLKLIIMPVCKEQGKWQIQKHNHFESVVYI